MLSHKRLLFSDNVFVTYFLANGRFGENIKKVSLSSAICFYENEREAFSMILGVLLHVPHTRRVPVLCTFIKRGNAPKNEPFSATGGERCR